MKTRSKKRKEIETEQKSSKIPKETETLVSNVNTKDELTLLKEKQEELLIKEKELEEKLKTILIQTEELRKEKEKEEKEKKRLEELYQVKEDVIVLNVGGKLISTTKATLTSEKESMLFAMFSDRYKLTSDKDGYIFIDRNPKYFKIILEFLRTRQFFGLENVDIKQLNAELEFFAFPFRITSCNNSIRYLKQESNQIYVLVNPEFEGIYEIFKYSENHKVFRYKLYLDNTSIKNHDDHPYITSGEATVALNQTKWFIEIHPKGEASINTEERGFAVFLHYKTGPKCLIGYSLSVVNQFNFEKYFTQKVQQTVFEAGENFGFRKLAPLKEIYEKDSGFIVDHCLFIDVEINYLRTFSD